ncbi:MAG: hypothetical protein WBF95_06580, partial [Comamonas thiooxydans]
PTTVHEEGEKQNLIHILSLAAQVKGWVSLRWKSRVSFAWKLTRTNQKTGRQPVVGVRPSPHCSSQ